MKSVVFYIFCWAEFLKTVGAMSDCSHAALQSLLLIRSIARSQIFSAEALTTWPDISVCAPPGAAVAQTHSEHTPAMKPISWVRSPVFISSLSVSAHISAAQFALQLHVNKTLNRNACTQHFYFIWSSQLHFTPAHMSLYAAQFFLFQCCFSRTKLLPLKSRE